MSPSHQPPLHPPPLPAVPHHQLLPQHPAQHRLHQDVLPTLRSLNRSAFDPSAWRAFRVEFVGVSLFEFRLESPDAHVVEWNILDHEVKRVEGSFAFTGRSFQVVHPGPRIVFRDYEIAKISLSDAQNKTILC